MNRILLFALLFVISSVGLLAQPAVRTTPYTRGLLLDSSSLEAQETLQAPVHNARWYGATGNGSDDDTAEIQDALNSFGPVLLDDGVYMVSSLTLNATNVLYISPKATLRWNQFLTNGNYSMLVLTNGAQITGGGIIDANASAFEATRATVTAYPWPKAWPIQIRGGSNTKVSNITITNTFDEAIYCIYATNALFENIIVTDCGAGPKFTRCEDLTINGLTVKDTSMEHQGVYQHAMDFFYGVRSKVSNLRIENVSGAQVDSSHSDQLSGIIIGGERSSSFSDILIAGVGSGNTLVPTPMATDGLWYSSIKNVVINGWGGGPQWEVNGCVNSIYSDILIDARGVAAGGSTVSSRGFFLREDGVTPLLDADFEDAQARDRSPTSYCIFTGVVVLGARNGIDVSGSYNKFINCAAVGNQFNGVRLKEDNAATSTGIWGIRLAQAIVGNEFIGCNFSGNGSYGLDYWSGTNNRFVSCTFNNNGQTSGGGIGIINERHFFTTISSATTSNITVVGTPYTAGALINRYALICTGGNTPAQLTRILTNTTSVLTVEDTLSPVPTGSDSVAVVDGPQGNIELIHCQASDDQDFTLTDAGSLDPSSVTSGNLTNLTRIVINGAGDRFTYYQRILLKGVATGGSDNDVIVRVDGHELGTDIFEVTPITLGDGTALSTASLAALTNATVGTIVITNKLYEVGVNPATSGEYSEITGTGTAFETEIDGHFWIHINGEYQQIWKLDSDTVGYTTDPFVSTTGGAFTVVKFDVEGIPSQDYGRVLNRYKGTVSIEGLISSGNIIAEQNDFQSPGVTAGTFQGLITYYRTDANPVIRLQRNGSVTNDVNFAGGRFNLVSPGNGQWVFTDSETTSANKTLRFGSNHYNTSEEPFYGLLMQAQLAANVLQLGGGSALGNSATQVDLITGATTTTTTGTTAGRFDNSTTGGQTRFLLYDVDNATLERVTVGAADSGGVGFKVLRIPN